MSFISAPGLEALEARLAHTDPSAIYQNAARTVAVDILEPAVQRAATSAGMSDDAVDALGTYTHDDGSVYVGLGQNSSHHDELSAFEHGTFHSPPVAPILATAVTMRPVLRAEFKKQLDIELRKALG